MKAAKRVTVFVYDVIWGDFDSNEVLPDFFELELVGTDLQDYKDQMKEYGDYDWDGFVCKSINGMHPDEEIADYEFEIDEYFGD